MDPVPVPEPLASDLQAYLADVQQLGQLQQQATQAQQANDQAAAALTQAQQAVQQQQAVVGDSRAKVNADLDGLLTPQQMRMRSARAGGDGGAAKQPAPGQQGPKR